MFYKDGFGIKITHEGWFAKKQRNISHKNKKKTQLHVFYKDGFGIKITHEGWFAKKQRNISHKNKKKPNFMLLWIV